MAHAIYQTIALVMLVTMAAIAKQHRALASRQMTLVFAQHMVAVLH